MVVIPSAKSPLEGWRFLPEQPTSQLDYQSQTFEGIYEWQFHTLAYAQNEWASTTPWNAPSSATLQPGQTRTYGLQFLLSTSGVRGIEATLQASNRPVAVTIPGTILPADQKGKLFLHAPSAVSTISVTPSGALSWATNSEAKATGWVGYTITASGWGRARLSITYADGNVQTVHYWITKAATQTIGDLGNFLTTSQWYASTSDPFKRGPSVMTYDRETNSVVLNDPRWAFIAHSSGFAIDAICRVWISGLADEAGAGSYLSAMMKQYAQPNANELAKLQQFVSLTLNGTLQNSDSMSNLCQAFTRN